MYQEKRKGLRQEHIIYCFRQLRRIISQQQNDKIEVNKRELVEDWRYGLMKRDLVDLLGELNEQECVELIFWVRKFKTENFK